MNGVSTSEWDLVLDISLQSRVQTAASVKVNINVNVIIEGVTAVR